MEFYLSDILDIVVEYIHRHRLKNKLINSFYLPIISFININKKYYRFEFCKKYIASQYQFSVSSHIQTILSNYILALNNQSLSLPVSFETEMFLELLELLIKLCKRIINTVKDETNNTITSYQNELESWVKSECFCSSSVFFL